MKHQCHKNGFVFIVQDHGWTLPNGSHDCSLFYKNSLHLVEHGNVTLAKSIVSTLPAQNNQTNLSFKNHNTLHIDVSKQSVPATISFSFKEDDFPPFTNVCRPVSKSGSCSNHVTARSIVVSSNVSGHVKRMYQCKPVKAVVRKSNVCNSSIVSQQVKPLNVSKSMSSCNVRSRNIHMVNSVSYHTKPLSDGKSDCSRNVSKPVICKSLHVKPLKVRKSISSCNARNRSVHIVIEVFISYIVTTVTRNNFSRNKF